VAGGPEQVRTEGLAGRNVRAARTGLSEAIVRNGAPLRKAEPARSGLVAGPDPPTMCASTRQGSQRPSRQRQLPNPASGPTAPGPSAPAGRRPRWAAARAGEQIAAKRIAAGQIVVRLSAAGAKVVGLREHGAMAHDRRLHLAPSG
jgi:hypothetical protein